MRSKSRTLAGLAGLAAAALAVLPFAPGCGSEAPTAVTLYCATDQHTAEKIVELFEERSGLNVRARYDTEANKTVGLVNLLFEEKENPRCDVFWNNEVMHTVRLAEAGLLDAYESPSASDIPFHFRDQTHLWAGFAARARILIVNTDLLPTEFERPKRVADLALPEFGSRATIAKPLLGTTLTHVAALASRDGARQALDLLDRMLGAGVTVSAGNAQVMRRVSSGEFACGLTDTDDFRVAELKGFPVAAVYPDQGETETGTFLIPNTVALVKGGPNPEGGKLLVDFLLSAEVEEILAKSKSAQIPLRASVKRPKNVRSAADFKVAAWDAEAAAKAMASILPELETLFAR